MGRVDAMSEIRHLRCDRCDVDIIIDPRSFDEKATGRDWARCMVALDSYDFCPNCWRDILTFADKLNP